MTAAAPETPATPGQAAQDRPLSDYLRERGRPGIARMIEDAERNAVTPGQAALSPSAYAAYEAHAMAAPDELNFREPDKLDDWEYPAWEAAAQAAYETRADEEDLAARQPQPAPFPAPTGFRLITDTSGIRHMVDAGGVRQLTEIDRERGYWELAISSGNQAAIVQFAAGILAAWGEPEPQPAPGEIRTCYCGTTAPVSAAFPHDDCDGSVPQPAPEPAAARPGEALAADNARLRDVVTEVLSWFGDNGSGRYARVSGTVLARAYAKAPGVMVPEELRRFL